MMVLSAIVLIAFILFAGWFAKARTAQLKAKSEFLDKFYHSAEALMKEGDTPDAVLALVSRMSDCLDSRRLVWSVFSDLLRGRTRAFYQEHQGDLFKSLHEQISVMRPEMQKHFYVTLIASLMAITYNNLFLGAVLRRVMFFDLIVAERSRDQQPSSRTEHLVVRFFGPGNNGDNGNGCCTAAA